MFKNFNIRKAVKFGIVAVGVSVVCSAAIIGAIVGTLGVLACL